uniref:Uncharacterized protein n=1 Tax=Anguilla anguilla TaxID=7936 RepID=A0A0E9UWR6_ANGAN
MLKTIMTSNGAGCPFLCLYIPMVIVVLHPREIAQIVVLHSIACFLRFKRHE